MSKNQLSARWTCAEREQLGAGIDDTRGFGRVGRGNVSGWAKATSKPWGNGPIESNRSRRPEVAGKVLSISTPVTDLASIRPVTPVTVSASPEPVYCYSTPETHPACDIQRTGDIVAFIYARLAKPRAGEIQLDFFAKLADGGIDARPLKAGRLTDRFLTDGTPLTGVAIPAGETVVYGHDAVERWKKARQKAREARA